MSDHSQTIRRLIELMTQMQLDEPTDAQVQELEGLLDNPSARRLYIEVLGLQGHIETAFTKPSASQADANETFDQIMSALLVSEEAAEPMVVPLHKEPEQPARPEDPSSLSGHDFAAAGKYLLRHALTSKVAIYAYAAAIILLVGVLLVPWGGNESPNPEPIASDNPNTPAASTESTPRGSTVATLTAEHDAVWASQPGGDVRPGALRPGTQLTVGQRLTLTQGFAEITTSRGAIAILEAPATIELTDNDNAIRLHTGKLVGICETESSKGFLVRTPHLDITDLGTRFGVDVADTQRTKLHVFEGEVQALASDTSQDEPVVKMVAGQSAVSDAATGKIEFQDGLALRFVSDWSVVDPGFETQGGVRYASAIPTGLAFEQTQSGQILIFPERKGFALPAPTGVSLSRLEGPDGFKEQIQLPAGTRVDTYLLQLNTPDTPGDRRKPIVTGSVRFDQPILGVIAQGESLFDSHRDLGVPGIRYPGMYRSGLRINETGLDTTDWNDTFTISDDRRTLTLKMFSSQSIDQARVLIAAQPQ